MAHDSHTSGEFDTVVKSVTYLILYILPAVVLMLGCGNLYLAPEPGNRIGLTLFDVFQNWQDRPDITQQYSHSYLTV